MLNPSYELPSRFTISRSLLVNKYEDVCAKMSVVLNGVEFVTLTTDMWTSSSTESFMAVTAHFVSNDWKLHSMLLDCSRFVGAHTNNEIRDSIYQICRRWNLHDKVHAIVTDNAANIKLAVKRLGWAHLPCLAHTLNLVVKDAIKLQMEPIRAKVKAIVEYFHRSTSGADLFKAQQKSFFAEQQRAEEREKRQRRNVADDTSAIPLSNLDDDDIAEVAEPVGASGHAIADEAADEDVDGVVETASSSSKNGGTSYKLINDVETRWNSTLYMYERVCMLRNPLVSTLALLKDKKIVLPSLDADDFIVMEEACQILKPFAMVTVELSAEQNVSGSKVVIVLRQIMKSLRAAIRNDNLCATSKNLAQNLLDGLKERYPKVEFDPLLAKASFLDPRFKKYGITLKEAYSKCKDLVLTDIERVARADLYEDQPVAVVTGNEEDVIWGDLDRENASHLQTATSSAAIELRHYVEEAPIDRKCDPLEWWCGREKVYPRMAKLARKNLSLVATSVPSERVFSAAGEVLSKKRNRLSNNNVQKIVVLHGNQRYFQ